MDPSGIAGSLPAPEGHATEDQANGNRKVGDQAAGDVEVGKQAAWYSFPAEQETAYRSLREAVGILVRDDLAVLAMWGRDPVRMLNGLITNDLARLTPTASVYAAMLTPKGRMITDLRVVRASPEDGAPELLMVVPAVAAATVGEHLKKYVPPLFARWEDRRARIAVIGVFGPRSATAVSALLGSIPSDLPGSVSAGFREDRGILAIAEPLGSVSGYNLLLPSEIADEVREVLAREAERMGGGMVGPETLETVRIEAGAPRFGREMTEETLPAEAFESTGRMADAVSFSKGCYTGQEVVVRIAHRGHVNRHIRGVLLGAVAPEAGLSIHHPETGKEVGTITSAARSPMMAQTIGLGPLRREIGPGDAVRIGAPDGPLGEVADLPFRLV